jgi:hypothetical protein
MHRARRSLAVTIAAGAVAAAAVASVASGGPAAAGYNTTQAPMVTPLAGAPAGSSADAIISVGDTIGGYTFESIPDGVSVYPRGNGRADVYVNHETSTVPFPYNAPFGGVGAAGEANQNDFTNSEVSLLEMKQHKVEINQASKAIATMENFQRFCSNYLATAVEGFKRPILFTNEEAQDWVFRSGTAWPGPSSITPGTAGAEQAGVVVAHDVRNGKTKPIYSMGRHNHENSVAVPGFDELVVLSGDDTFQTNAPASSQLYMYTASDTDELWADAGTLHAFVADGTDKEYFNLQPGETISGNFLPVPPNIAKGKAADGHELTRAVDFPSYPAPSGGPSLPPDGPQWILDQWGNAVNTPSVNDVPGNDNDVFDFIRLEDIAYDKRPNMSNVVYIADSGRASAGAANQLSNSTNGRIYKMVLDPDGTGDPTEAEISILVQGDDVATAAVDPVNSFNEIHQPDNLETTVNGNLLVTEDPSSRNQYAPPAGTNKTTARLWKVPLGAANPDAAKVPIIAVDQALDENANAALGAIDQDLAGAANLGAWESSGIADASAGFGAGAFFLTVQAHSYWIAKAAGPDILNSPNGQDYVYKKEGGQLILLTLPGI